MKPLFTLLLLASSALAQTAVSQQYQGIDYNSFGFFPTTIQHQIGRMWDNSGVEWPFINTCANGTNICGATATVFDFTALDSQLATMFTNNVTLVQIALARTPNFASSNPGDVTCNYYKAGSTQPSQLAGQCDPPSDLATNGTGANLYFDNWVAALAAHVNSAGYADSHARMLIYEVWNEPNVSGFFTGSYDQLRSMEIDAKCIINTTSGTNPYSGRTCAQIRTAVTSVVVTGPIDPTALVIMPSYPNASAVPNLQAFLYCTGPAAGLSSCTHTNAGALWTDAINFHMKWGNAYPASLEATADSYLTLMNAALQAAELAKPYFNTEGGYSATGWSPPYTDCDMESSYLARNSIYSLFKGISNNIWYNWRNTVGLGVSTACNAPTGIAYSQASSWITGATFTSCPAAGTVYTCAFTTLQGYSAAAIWDISQSCSGGVCTTANQTVASNFTQYLDLAGDPPIPIAAHTVAVGIKPLFLVAVPTLVNAETLSGGGISGGGFGSTPAPSSCGAPAFLCSATNVTAAVQPPLVPPFSGDTGADTYNANPAAGNPLNIDNAPLLRVTDKTTGTVKHTFAPTGGGTLDKGFNAVSPPTWITYQDSGGFFYFNHCNLSLVTPTCALSGAFNSRTFTKIQTEPEFSAVNATRFYYLSNAGGTSTGSLLQYADVTAPGTPSTLFDYSTCNGWNGSNIFNTDPARHNDFDTAFITGYSAVASQNRGRQMVAYVPGGGSITAGCYLVDTGTTAIYGPAGLVGHYNPAHGTFAIHQVAPGPSPVPEAAVEPTAADTFNATALSCAAGTATLTYTTNAQTTGIALIAGESVAVSGTTNFNGTFTVLTANSTSATWSQTCVGGSETHGLVTVKNDNGTSTPFLWTPGQTDIVSQCPSPAECSGHWAIGSTGFINNYQHATFAFRPFSAPATPTILFPSPNPCNPPSTAVDDWHGNVQYSAAETSYVMGASTTGKNAPTYTWSCQNEVLGFLPSATASVKRFSFTYQVPTWQFSNCEGISLTSHDGNWVMFASTMQDSLGTEDGSPLIHGTACQGPFGGTGGNARGDIILVDLRGQ